MLACSSPKLFAAGRVLHRRMAPWHPPCALCSLIFSSLDPETNLSLEVWFAFPLSFQPLSRPSASDFPLPTLHNWSAFLSESLLCAVVKVRALTFALASACGSRESQFSSGVCFAVSFPMNPENDTGSSSQDFLTAVLFDALCVSCVTHSLSVHTRRFPAFSR